MPLASEVLYKTDQLLVNTLSVIPCPFFSILLPITYLDGASIVVIINILVTFFLKKGQRRDRIYTFLMYASNFVSWYLRTMS
jgi:hypothetical protein